MSLTIAFICALISFSVITFSLRFEKAVSLAILSFTMTAVNVLGGGLIGNLSFVNASMGTLLYATLLFGLILMCEKYGISYARKTVLIIFFVTFLFQVYTQFTVRLDPASFAKDEFNALISLSPVGARNTIASIFAFIIAGLLAIQLYAGFKNRMGGKMLWIACLVSLLVAQVIDSIIFFGGSFIGIMSTQQVLVFIEGGLLIKSVLTLVSILFFSIAQSFTNKGVEDVV